MATGVGSAAGRFAGEARRSMRFIVAAASSGTIIEWYDFYIFVTLGFILTPLFFKLTSDPAVNFLAFLATYASGFAVRPFGAIVFGRIGDLVGRKYAFLLTVTIMGLGTAAIAFIPVYDQIGLLAPLALMTLRCLQGLALGGEYGGAAIYVAEHAPDERRGYWTSYIQTTATVGLFVSSAVILVTDGALGPATFAAWGWRIPFPLFIVFGRLSDRIGRKKIMMAGCLLAALSYAPLYAGMQAFGNPLNVPVMIGLVFIQVVWVTMVYGPIAAFLVEFFPARIRYTCLSLPYHLGNGEFGGFTPLIFFAVYGATSGNLYLALLWPILVPIMTFVIGMIWLPETKDTKIWEEVTPAPAYGGPASMSRAGADVGPTMKGGTKRA